MAEAGLQPNFGPADLEWKYWHPRTDWPGPRSFVVARGEEILAHAGVIPGAFLASTQTNCRAHRIRAAHVIDWAARPSAVGAGVMLMKHIGQATEALFAIGGSAQTRKLLPHLGFQSMGDVACYVRPLHPVRILAPSAHPPARLLPRFLRSVLWSSTAPSRHPVGWTVRRISSGEATRLTSILPSPTQHMTVLERGETLFRHVLACPIAESELYLMEREGRARGYFLLTYAMRQARLADCWMDSDNPSDWRALVQSAALQAKRHPQAAELAAWASLEPLSLRLRECGFHVRANMPVQTLAPRHPELLGARLRVQMIDNDAAFHHSGRNEFWA
jgi:hypothetical protein